ncbi:hypothetical protein BJ165DRAFT_1571645 [Panaeolus papilionaceus]|nr:hypothetical protein BJ165DRAFT_1571645 [Panaeolus papilionaceus]
MDEMSSLCRLLHSAAAAASTSRKTSRAAPSAPGVPVQRIMSGIPQEQLMTFSIEPSPTSTSTTPTSPLGTEPALQSLSRNPSKGSLTSKWRLNEPTESVVKQAVPSGSESRSRHQSVEMNPPQPIESLHSYQHQLLEAFSMPNPPLGALGSPHSTQCIPKTPQSTSSSTLFDPNSFFGIPPTPETSFQDDETDALAHGSQFMVESDSDSCTSQSTSVGRSRRQRLSRGQVFYNALKVLSDSKLTALDLLEATARGSEVEISTYHDKFYTDGNRDRLERILDLVWTGSYKRTMMGRWMDRNAVEHVQGIAS